MSSVPRVVEAADIKFSQRAELAGTAGNIGVAVARLYPPLLFISSETFVSLLATGRLEAAIVVDDYYPRALLIGSGSRPRMTRMSALKSVHMLDPVLHESAARSMRLPHACGGMSQ